MSLDLDERGNRSCCVAVASYLCGHLWCVQRVPAVDARAQAAIAIGFTSHR